MNQNTFNWFFHLSCSRRKKIRVNKLEEKWKTRTMSELVSKSSYVVLFPLHGRTWYAFLLWSYLKNMRNISASLLQSSSCGAISIYWRKVSIWNWSLEFCMFVCTVPLKIEYWAVCSDICYIPQSFLFLPFHATTPQKVCLCFYFKYFYLLFVRQSSSPVYYFFCNIGSAASI